MVMSRIGWVISSGCRNDFERVAKRSRDKRDMIASLEMSSKGFWNKMLESFIIPFLSLNGKNRHRG